MRFVGQLVRDTWWMRSRRLHAYTCPLLMTVSMWLERLAGRPARWKHYRDGSEPSRICIALPSGSGYEISCRFPPWAIRAEMAFRECWFRRKCRKLRRAAESWRRDAPPELRGLLDARSIPGDQL